MKAITKIHIDNIICVFMVILFTSFVIIFKPNWFISVKPKPMDEPGLSIYKYVIQPEEREFPLAYSILIFRDFERVLRLLNAIYRPHNAYCLHIDKKCSHQDYRSVKNYTRHMENVYILPNSDRLDVTWGTFSVLNAELTCARVLLAKHRKWKYFINLTGQEFPLRTNWELVEVLKILNGSNLAFPYGLQRLDWKIPDTNDTSLNITWVEGTAHVALRRDFLDYIFTDTKAQNLLRMIRNHEVRTGIFTVPDEQYFPILNLNPKVFPAPGAYKGSLEDYKRIPPFIRLKIWTRTREHCFSRIYRHGICILGLEDSLLAMNKTQLFANKFAQDVEPEGYEILERWIASKVAYEAQYHQLHPTFLPNYYAQFDLSWNHV